MGGPKTSMKRLNDIFDVASMLIRCLHGSDLIVQSDTNLIVALHLAEEWLFPDKIKSDIVEAISLTYPDSYREDLELILQLTKNHISHTFVEKIRQYYSDHINDLDTSILTSTIFQMFSSNFRLQLYLKFQSWSHMQEEQINLVDLMDIMLCEMKDSTSWKFGPTAFVAFTSTQSILWRNEYNKLTFMRYPLLLVDSLFTLQQDSRTIGIILSNLDVSAIRCVDNVLCRPNKILYINTRRYTRLMSVDVAYPKNQYLIDIGIEISINGTSKLYMSE